MAQTRQDGAPAGTSYACFVCGYDTRWNPWSKEKDSHGHPKDDGVGEYVIGIGVRHKTTKECSRLMDHFMDRRYDLSLRAREGEKVD